MAHESQIPPLGAQAANVLLDAVISQSSTQTTAVNIKAMSIALATLTPDEDYQEKNSKPAPSDVVGAAVVCISWLAAHLAAATAVDLEDVVADLRDFIEHVAEPPTKSQ